MIQGAIVSWSGTGTIRPPLAAQRPVSDWSATSVPRRPPGPKADSEQWIRRGLRASASSAPAPRRSATPGEKLWTSTSAPSIRAPSASRPSGVRRSSTIPRLSRFAAWNWRLSPSTSSTRRHSSPAGGSTFTTSAPSWPSAIVASGPPRWWVRSTTRIPASGPAGGVSGMAGLRGAGAVTLSSCAAAAKPPSAGPSRPRQPGGLAPRAMLARVRAQGRQERLDRAGGRAAAPRDPSAWAARGTTATRAGAAALRRRSSAQRPVVRASRLPRTISTGQRAAATRSSRGMRGGLAQRRDDAARPRAHVVADAAAHQARPLHGRVDREPQHLGERGAEAAVEGRAQQHQRRHALGMAGREARGDVAAVGVAGQDGPGEAAGVEQPPHGLGDARGVARSPAPRRCARSRAGRSSPPSCRRGEAPGQGAEARRRDAEPVQQDDRLNSAGRPGR